jgi:lysophospholipase L1-like esterase
LSGRRTARLHRAASERATKMTPPLSGRRRAVFLGITLLSPWILLAVLEVALRLLWPGGAMPAFDPIEIDGRSFLAPGRTVSRRYFPNEVAPPTPPVDVFAAAKPASALRIFVLGESSAAGFPYPHNGTFSRVLRDVLHDVLPGDSVEVVNLGIAATNSFTMVDLTGEIIAQRPDAVLIYAGHNEYYGALGIGSSVGSRSSPRLTRAYLVLMHLRLAALLRTAFTALHRASERERPDPTSATFMESVAHDQQIALGSARYKAGLKQFHDNVDVVLRRFRDAGIPVFIGSIASNVRDQPPFASPSNGPARSAFDSARVSFLRGDSASAYAQYRRARDLDVIRFRAPSALNEVIRRLADADGAHYVPAAESIEAVSPARSPGHELFLEHVHPNRHGQVLLAEAYFTALRSRDFLGQRIHLDRLASWREYEARMELTPFDERVAEHSVRSVSGRWPFVPRALETDYRGTYVPTDLVDSLALTVSRGGLPWAEAKLEVAALAASHGHADSALAEYRGLVRDTPFLELPNRLMGESLVALGRAGDAIPYLERALRLHPTGRSAYLLGIIALDAHQLDRAIVLLDYAARLSPTAAEPVLKLSIAFGLAKNVGAARAAAARAAALDPRLPGLSEWMSALGMRTP